MNHKSLTCCIMIASLTLAIAIRASGQNNATPADKDLRAGSSVLMQADELAKLLKDASGAKPLIFFVGPRAFYQQAHVPGAEFLGPTARAEGLEKLRARAASLPRDRSIVIYCGCCPWIHCPNIHPAYNELKKMGFGKLRVLFLENSFGTNWVEKGYPVEKGS